MARSFDLIIVGGGIHGAGVAQAAAVEGYSVLLLESRLIGAGSSSRSSKLIHGGLRYLESGQFRLVQESLHERTTLLRIAPELVRLERFYLPVYRHTRRRPWQLRAGLTLYALLAGLRTGAGFGTLPRARWGELDGLDTQDLQAVLWYQDGRTDDQALTRAVIGSAQDFGAEVQMPARFIGAQLLEQVVRVRYEQDGTPHECEARALVNAAGPWVSQVARAVSPAISVPATELVQGTHILLKAEISQGVYYVEAPHDGRAVFIMSWYGQLMAGTTEVPYHGDPAQVAPTASEIDYLQGIARHYFPRLRDAAEHPLTGSFAGLRVLPSGKGRAFNRSRETLLVTDRRRQPRVLSIYGGKLTTWRAVAARALGQLAPTLPARAARGRTDEILLRPR